MDAKLITEFTLLSQRFAEEKQTNGNLVLQLAALDRDEQEINDLLTMAFQLQEDVVPVLTQLQENFIQREQATKAMRESLPQMEALSRQSADAISRLIASNKNP